MKGIYPRSGGWRDQLITDLVHIQAMDMVYDTWKFIQADEPDFTKLTGTQKKVIAYLEET